VRPPRIQEQLAHVRLGTVCRLSLEKGIQNLFHAVSRLLTRGIDVSCVVAGAGPLLNDLIRLARELGISERVVLNGAVPHSEIDRFLTSEVDVFVLPSLSEGVPKVVLEAMAAGIPIVATAVGGIPEMLGESGERGWLVPAGDVSALADAIESCVKDTDERVKRCEEAHKYVIDHTLEAEAGRIEAVILGLIAKD